MKSKNNYFNALEFRKIIEVADVNPFLAKELYERYLDKYPKDYTSYSYYAGILITLGELDKAEEVLNKLNILISKEENVLERYNRLKKIKENISFVTLKYLIYKNDYNSALDYCDSNPYVFSINVVPIKLYLKSKLGLLESCDRDDCNYLKRQLIEYQEEDFLEHIKNHQADYNIDIDDPNDNIFVPEFDTDKIISEVKKYIPSNKKLFSGFFEDTYYFKYDECGRINNRLYNYFKVVCFHDTDKFITMYVFPNGDNFPYIDLNYLKEKEDSKIKKISQIDKFYKRYGKM